MPHTHARAATRPPVPKPSTPCPPNITGGGGDDDEDDAEGDRTLDSMTFVELRRLASLRGVSVPKGATKASLMARLSEE